MHHPVTDLIYPPLNMREEEPSTPSLQGASPTRASAIRPKRLRILVIDDDPPFLRTMARRLAPHHVALAEGAVEAFTILDEFTPDVIFCDVNMPNVRGVAVYEYLRRVFPGEEERLVFMTGEPLQPGPRAYLGSVPNPVLQKPIADDALELAVAAALTAPRFDISRASLTPRPLKTSA